jgi:hypothetical protein
MRHLFALFAALFLIGCGDDDEKSSGTADDPSTACNEANEECGTWNCSGEGSRMLPGADCLACHTQGNMPEDDEPDKWYTIGGTVFEDLDGTAAASDVIVRITDADGRVVELSSNSVGNFYGQQDLVMPITAELERDGAVVSMATEVGSAACSSCHSCDGAAGGKLAAP